METYELNIKVKVTGEDIDDIVCTAFEGGITYWCRKAEVVGEYLGEYASDQISRGGKVILYDAESNDKWELNKDNFLKGLQKFLTIKPSATCDGEIDTCYIDAGDADDIIQYALFDELVFG